MSTKRDLVEAHAYSRRRLVTAFVSGAPGGREVEPARPARAIIGGIALGVLLIAGAAMASIFAGRSPADWTDPGIVISKENGNHYVILADGAPLQPVVNPVSAQLLMGQVAPKSVKQEDISTHELGARIGIYNAPNNVPVPDLMRNSGWTACLGPESATKVFLGESPVAEPVADAAVVVRTSASSGDKGVEQHWLIAPSADSERGHTRLAISNQHVDRLLSDLGLDGARPQQVDARWLSLFPLGPPLTLDSFGLAAPGKPVAYADSLGNPDLRTGQLVQNSGADEDRIYVLDQDGPRLLDRFAVAVYKVVSGQGEPIPVTGHSGERIPRLAAWPSAIPQPVGGEACGILSAAPGEAATVHLATAPSEDESAATLDPGEFDVAVQPGYGAYVNVGQFGDSSGGSPVIIDMDAKRYRLGGPKGETAELLGLTSITPPTVPDAWTENFTCGPELSQEAARRAPDPRTAECG